MIGDVQCFVRLSLFPFRRIYLASPHFHRIKNLENYSQNVNRISSSTTAGEVSSVHTPTNGMVRLSDRTECTSTKAAVAHTAKIVLIVTTSHFVLMQSCEIA